MKNLHGTRGTACRTPTTVKKQRKKAVTLKYEPGKDTAPRLTAKGEGLVAQRILELAREAGVPIHEDQDLVEILSKLDLYQEIPPETYMVVAEILAWIYRLNAEKSY